LDGQLGDCKWLDEHIAECSECLAEYEAIQRINHLAQKTDFPPPESSYWRKFGTRVIARIAARPSSRPRRYSSILDVLFARRLAVRLVMPLLVVLIAVLAIKTYTPHEKLKGLPPETQVSVPNQVENENEAIAINKITDNKVISDAVNNQEPEAATQSQDLADNTEPIENYVDTGTEPKSVSNDMSLAENNLNQAEEEIIEPANTDELIASYLNRRPVKTSYTRDSGLSNGIWADLTANLKLTDFNTDQVIMFQILSGSNPSLAPISSYREAAGKFFAPEISTSRNLFELDITGRWGYASGDGDFDDERLHHLKLELDLIKEK